MKVINQEVAKKLRKLRKDKKMSQKLLSVKIELSQSTISYLESGLERFSDDMCEKYCDFFNISIEELETKENE